MVMGKGLFIVFEGLDGCGKTTQAEFAARFFESQGRDVVLTREPTESSDAGKTIKKVLAHEETRSPKEFQELFAQDRRAHLDALILPALREGKAVISDRYFLSSIAFGSVGCDIEWLIKLNSEFPSPDLTIILSVLPEHCIERIYARSREVKLFEKLDVLKKVWETYQKLSGRFPNICVIDGERPIDRVSDEIRTKLAALL